MQVHFTWIPLACTHIKPQHARRESHCFPVLHSVRLAEEVLFLSISQEGVSGRAYWILAACSPSWESLWPSLIEGTKQGELNKAGGVQRECTLNTNRSIYCCLLLFQSRSAKEISQQQKKHLSEEIIVVTEIRKPSSMFVHTLIAWHLESQWD